MSNWIYKGYSRVYVNSADQIEKVQKIIKGLDEDEWAMYAPKGLVAVWTGSHDLIYNHKFELDVDKFYQACLELDVAAWAVSSHEEQL